MVRRWKGLSLAARIAILAAIGLLLLSTAAYGYFAFRTSGAPAPASLGEAPESRGGPSDLDGNWVLAEDAGFAGYRVREKLGFVPAPNDAVGRTTAVRGAMTIADGRIESAQVTADLLQLRSDEPGRDPAAQEALATQEFPNGTFRLAEPVDLRSPERGEVVSFEAASVVTLRGIAREVQFPLEARWNGDTFQVAGQLEIQRSDFELEFPQQVGLRVSDDAKIEVELTFVHQGAQGATPPPTTTDESNEEEQPSAQREPRATGPGRLLVSMMEEGGDTIAIYAVNVDGSELVRLVRPLRRSGAWSSDLAPELSPDGSKVVYTRGIATQTSGEPDQIYVLDLSRSSRPRQLTDESFTATLWPTWSPDGSTLAFARSEGDSSSIWVMGATGKNPRSLTEDDLVEEETLTPDEFPTWSPDGERIAYTSFLPDGNDDIFVMNANGSSPTRLTSGPEYDSDPDWSPNGELIAFSRDGDIYTMRPDGSDVRQLTQGSARDGAPAWSRDGRWLAFARADESGTTFAGPSRIIVMRANGSRLGRVRLPGEAFWPSWAS